MTEPHRTPYFPSEAEAVAYAKGFIDGHREAEKEFEPRLARLQECVDSLQEFVERQVS